MNKSYRLYALLALCLVCLPEVQADWSLLVVGNPVNHGTPSPLGYGINSNITDKTWITNTVANPSDLTNNTVKSDCLGWNLAYASGLPVTNDSSTQAVFQMVTNLTLTWNWTNEYYLAVTTNSHGTATPSVSGWYTNGVQVQLSATPDSGYVFLQWSGDVPTGGNTNNPLTVTMDRPRAIQAQFASDTPQTRTWNGKGNWFTTTNWTPQGIPGTGDVVYINSGTNVLADPVTVASLTISNATLIFSNWSTTLSAPNVTISSNGVMTLPTAFNNVQMSNRVSIVCSTLMVAAGGQINADGKGYAGGPTEGGAPSGLGGPGSGPGGGGYGKFGAAGGGYGGTGGTGNGDGYHPPGGSAYGITNAPMDPGSGGGGAWSATGSAGGGAVRIAAIGRVTINGIISANGVANAAGGGGGSGGGIYISCSVIGGATNAVVRAKGGNGTVSSGGGGGGGRIAVIYDNAAQSLEPKPHVPFAVDPGLGWGSVYATPGMLYLPDTVILDGAWMPYTGELVIPGSSWEVDRLTLGGWLRFIGLGFKLTVTNDITISGSVSGIEMPIGGEIHCGRNLTFTNGAALIVYSAATNGMSTNYGALVSVGGNLSIASNSWIYPYSDSTNGGSALFTMANLTIDAFGGFNADGRGYAGGTTAGSIGFGPGGGAGGGSTTSSGGGGYGGKGGQGENAGVWGGPTNGVINVPGPGSGAGGSPKAPPTVGSSGGGLVRIVATGTVTLNGIISATGSNKIANGYAGSGSGGGISIICAKLAGSTNGVMRANGGGSGANNGVGGGGRIAVITRRDLFTGEAPGAYVAYAGSTNGCITVNPGPGGTATSGTFYLQILPQPGTTLIVN